MGYRDVSALLKCATGTGIVTAVPHAVSLPPELAAPLALAAGVSAIITAAIVVVVGLTKLTTELTRLVEAFEKLRNRIRRLRKRPKAPQTKKGGTS